jgi:hypothetical protein
MLWLRSLTLFATLSSAAFAQGFRQDLSVGAGVLSPLSGYKADDHNAGPSLRIGYEIRLKKHIGAEAGWTGAWPTRTEFGRDFDMVVRDSFKLLDYGLRGVIPIAGDRAELSAGVGGGYIRQGQGPSESFRNDVLLQFSGRVTAPVGAQHRLRAGITVRAWRDLGRSTQQWLSTTGDLTYRFGR